jgi:hypothetical protein
MEMMVVAMMVRVASFQTTEDFLESGQILFADGCWRIVHIRVPAENFFCELVDKKFDLIIGEGHRRVA